MTFVLPLKVEASAAAQSCMRRASSPITPDEDYPVLSASPAGLQHVSTDLQRLSNYVDLLSSNANVPEMDLSTIPPPERFRSDVDETEFGAVDIAIRTSVARLPVRSSVPVLRTFQV